MNTPLTSLRLKALFLLAAGSYLPLPLHGAEFAFDLLPEAENQQLGSTFAAVGDVDGDGTADVAISDPSYLAEGLFGSGVVFIVSGADGSHLRTYLPEASVSSQYFGISLAALDANGDGTIDLAVGSPGYAGETGYGTGTVRVYSGTDGSLLSAGFGTASSQFGGAIANAGDQNGDGADDLYVGAPMAFSNRGAVFVQSGSDGSILRTIQADITFTTFGTSLAAVGDIDADGKPDLAVGAPAYRVSGNYLGRVLLIRSSDDTTVTQLPGTGSSPRLAYTLAPAADANGDGVGDLLVGSYSGGTALLVSGTDLTTIRDLSITGLPTFQPVNVGGGLDFDDDGVEDYLIGSPALNTATTPNPSGGVRIISGLDQSTLFEQLASAPFTGLGSGMRPLPGFGFAFGENSLTDAETGGRGIGHFWSIPQEDTPPPPVDTDDDGIFDDVDVVISSIMDTTVGILGVNSSVPNRVDATGTTLADRYAALPAFNKKKPAQYLVAVTLLTLDLTKKGLLTTKEATRIVAAATVGVIRGVLCR
ncbi:VCBS repeat-containing protein [Luteolibacter sp. Populi]|uniref:VCBS repeat-containing protein n=1 Tax=Luteolibacter sp. Populi TaxID=3230487 RepID=UPI00346697D7